MAGQNLTVLLNRHREEIARAWAEMVHRLPDSHYGERPLEELRASTLRAVGAIDFLPYQYGFVFAAGARGRRSPPRERRAATR